LTLVCAIAIKRTFLLLQFLNLPAVDTPNWKSVS